jgi:hypothetical protein
MALFFGVGSMMALSSGVGSMMATVCSSVLVRWPG